MMPEPVSACTSSIYDLSPSQGSSGTRFRLQLVTVHASGQEEVQEVARIERAGLEMETLGLTLTEGKLILKKIQEGVVQEQIHEALLRLRCCWVFRSM
jgi:hypothetical protein